MKLSGHLKTVVFRELRLMRHRPVYLAGSVAVMIFSSIFFITFLKDGMPEDLPIGIVDNDCTWASREFIRQTDATQLGKTVMYGSYKEAREALQTGKINALCVIPDNFYEDVLAQRQPTLSFYVNSLYFVGGALAYKDMLTMSNLASGAVQREVLRARGKNEREIMGMIQPILIDSHQIGNTDTDYGVYLTNVLLPGMLEMIIILVTVYALGSELKYGTSRNLLRSAGGSMWKALSGKLIPYTVIFILLGIGCELLLYHWMGFPMAGSVMNMFVAMAVFVFACEAVAIFIIGTLPVLRDAISVSAIYSVLGFSLAGFTFPVEAMPEYIRGLAAIFPLRHYYLLYVQEAFFGTGFPGWYMQIVYLLLFLFLPLTIFKRLYEAYKFQNFPRK